jgi:nitrogen fixation NifU-like protein
MSAIAADWSDRILDYYDDVSHVGPLAGCTHSGELTNASCGDRVAMEMIISAGHKIVAAAFTARGCCLSRAAAAMLAEKIQGLPLGLASQIHDDGMIELVGVGISPARRGCVLLPLRAFRLAIAEYIV